MLMDFVAMIAAGFAAGGVAMALRHTTRGRLPRWLTPAAAGAAMLAYSVWSEYDWMRRAEAGLPEGVTVVWRNAETASWKPWTYLWPVTTRIIAVDTRAALRHPAEPDRVLVAIVALGRWSPGASVGAVFDCKDRRRADLLDDAKFTEEGALEGVQWIELPPGDAALEAVCQGG